MTKKLNFTEKMWDKYYKGKITIKDIAKDLNVCKETIYSRMKENNIPTRKNLYKEINLPKDLSKNLMNKYSSLVDRCTKKRRYNNYYELQFLNAKEFVDFCNGNKEKLQKMWDKYINNDKQLKYAISIDRLDTNKGYAKNNIQFVTYGFNSWKDEITPLKVKYKNNVVCCFSKEEASRRLGFGRKKIIGEAERGEIKINIEINYLGNKEIILSKNKVKSLSEYHQRYIMKG